MMEAYDGGKWFTIHENDAGQEAFRETYVHWLENQLIEARNRLRCVVRNCQRLDASRERDEPGPWVGPTWAKVSQMTGFGATLSIALCSECNVDPHYDCSRQEQETK